MGINPNMQQYDWTSLTPDQRIELLRRPALGDEVAVNEQVGVIVARVRQEGDAALYALTRQLDGVNLDALEVDLEEIEAAEQALSTTQRQAIKTAAHNIERFHRAQLASAIKVETADGVVCERITRPLQRVGLYVPAGSAPLPSTALMLGVPARLAECQTRILCSPVQANGKVAPSVLYAAQVAGIQRIFKLGGAQAIAALAYGTSTVPKVDKIFGPGNRWVTAAKEQVDRDPDGAARDFPAGPSEVCVVADSDADPVFVAADLLSQAEHGPDSQALLITTSTQLAERVTSEVKQQKARLSRLDIIDRALRHSATIVVPDLDTAFAVANEYAPEHLILQLAEPRRWLEQVQAAGSVFLGPWAPEAVGDYCSGTNHVLPTYGYAKRCSSLGTGDFCRSMTVQELTPSGLRGIGPATQSLAALEGLDGHRNAVSVRLASLNATGPSS